MSADHCPIDGAFVSKDGTCSHANHQAPKKVTAEEGREILKGHPEVTDPKGQRVRFGERLERHLADKSPEEQARRLVKLEYALDAVRTTEPILHPRGMTDRNVYIKPTSEKSSVMVFVDNNGEVQEVFDVFSKNTKDVRKSIGR